MKAYDVIGYSTEDGEAYCKDCAGELADDDHAIFADMSENLSTVCDGCHETLADAFTG